MSERFMLDTDSVSYALRGQGNVGARLLDHRPSELCVSAITVAELRYGADLRKSRMLHERIRRFLTDIDVMPFDAMCGEAFGTVAAELTRRGSPIGEYDVLIAAHAVAIGATLVTNNVKHFARVRGLRVENWF